MKVYILAGSAFEARDLGRRLGLPVQDTVIVHSRVVVDRMGITDGDLILETATWSAHREHAAITEALLEKCLEFDVRWETEPSR